MTWAQRAGRFVAELTKDFPADMPLKERTRILTENAWSFTGGTSWGKKTYAKAKRQYLEAHGQPKGKGLPKAPTPLLDLALPKSPVVWVDHSDQAYTTAFLGAVIVGRVFYGEKQVRLFCNLSLNMGMSVWDKERSREKAVAAVESRVEQWLKDAGLQVAV